MKKFSMMMAILALGAFATGPAAFAKSSALMKACKGDLKKFGCKAKTDAAAHECLEKNEKEGQKDEGFSHACYEAHENYEKHSGKMEKEEKHE
jgi:hypothetical protein